MVAAMDVVFCGSLGNEAQRESFRPTQQTVAVEYIGGGGIRAEKLIKPAHEYERLLTPCCLFLFICVLRMLVDGSTTLAEW